MASSITLDVTVNFSKGVIKHGDDRYVAIIYPESHELGFVDDEMKLTKFSKSGIHYTNESGITIHFAANKISPLSVSVPATIKVTKDTTGTLWTEDVEIHHSKLSTQQNALFTQLATSQ
jgi:hypothetical protein